jgi:lipoprotein-releasing system permease protein
MTVVLDLGAFLYVAAFAILVNFFAGIYPAFKASRLDPVEAIATE